MKENEEITNLERFELLIEDCKGHRELYGESFVGEYDIEIMQHILSDYKRVLKENEELKNRWDKDTHILQNDLDIANAKNIEKDKIIDLMSEQLTTPMHNKEYVKQYFENKVNGGNKR